MTPYYEGTSEAEQLVRVAPELVDVWLKKARQDRRRLATRLFQPQRREFLDGFIQSLERSLAHPKEQAEPVSRVEVRPSETTVDSTLIEVDPIEVAPEPEPLPPLFELETRSEDPVGPTSEPSEAIAEVAVDVDDAPARAGDLASSGESLEAPGEGEPEPAALHALGIARLEGWTIALDPQGVESDRTGDGPIQPDVPDARLVAAVPWDQVFEQVRGVGMVDLSAYDVLDGLGDLRNLIDHWQNLRQDPRMGNEA